MHAPAHADQEKEQQQGGGTAGHPAAPVPQPMAPGPRWDLVQGHRHLSVLPGGFLQEGQGPRPSTLRKKGYRKFVNRSLPNDAVGKTQQVEGSVSLDAQGATASTFRVDLRTLASDSPRRDSYIQGRTLQTAQYPYAEFSIRPGAGAIIIGSGAPASFELPGTLKIHGALRQVTWQVKGSRQGSGMLWQATLPLHMSDFNIQAPDLASMRKVQDDLTLSISLTLQPA